MTQAAVAGGGVFNPASGLGPRLRRVREERGLSARELARRVGCSASLISQIERGVSAPSVGVLYALATELGASLDHLFGVGPGPGSVAGPVTGSVAGPVAGWAAGPVAGWAADPVAGWAADPVTGSVAGSVAGGLPDGHGLVQHAASRAVIDLASGVRWERLTPRSDGRTDFLEVIYQPDGHSTDERRALRHDGYEYGLILSGTLQANVGFDQLELGPGDSIAFDSSIPHEYWNRTDRDVRAVWVVVHSEPGRA